MIELKEIKALPTLMRWRAEVLEHVFGQKPSPRLQVANRQYYRSHIAMGTHKAYVAFFDGKEGGCGAICLSEELPSPDNPSGHCAYLMNIYVRQPYRNHGIGHAIVEKLIAEATSLNCGKIYLETTAQGRTLYQSMNFIDLPDIMIYKP